MSAALHRFLSQPSLRLVVVALSVAAPQACVRAQDAASVSVAVVRHETGVSPVVQLVGTILPARRSIIGSAVDGRVEAYHVEAGQKVDAKEELAQILTGTIDIEIAVAEAEREAQRAELEELKAGSRPEEIARAQAQLAAAEALSSYSASRLQRARRLAQTSGALSAEELDLAVSEQASAEQRKIEAIEALRLLEAGTRKERIDQAAARLAMAEETVNLLKDRHRKYTLRSPFEGYVVREYTEVGAWVTQGAPVAEVVELSTVDVEVNVPERMIPFLRTNMEVPVRLEAMTGGEFTGRVARIIPDADTRARTFPVRISIPNEPEDERRLIRPGMLARTSLPATSPVDGLTVPKDAVVLGGPSPFVYRNNRGVAEVVPIEIVVESVDRYVVAGGLKEGDQVVVRGNERLRPGSAIQVIPSAEN